MYRDDIIDSIVKQSNLDERKNEIRTALLDRIEKDLYKIETTIGKEAVKLEVKEYYSYDGSITSTRYENVLDSVKRYRELELDNNNLKESNPRYYRNGLVVLNSIFNDIFSKYSEIISRENMPDELEYDKELDKNLETNKKVKEFGEDIKLYTKKALKEKSRKFIAFQRFESVDKIFEFAENGLLDKELTDEEMKEYGVYEHFKENEEMSTGGIVSGFSINCGYGIMEHKDIDTLENGEKLYVHIGRPFELNEERMKFLRECDVDFVVDVKNKTKYFDEDICEDIDDHYVDIESLTKKKIPREVLLALSNMEYDIDFDGNKEAKATKLDDYTFMFDDLIELEATIKSSFDKYAKRDKKEKDLFKVLSENEELKEKILKVEEKINEVNNENKEKEKGKRK